MERRGIIDLATERRKMARAIRIERTLWLIAIAIAGLGAVAVLGGK